MPYASIPRHSFYYKYHSCPASDVEYADKVTDPEVRAYAWNWFALHAGQRLQLVNFWLVAIAFLAAAFVQSEINHLTPIAAGLAFIGALSSVAFQRLDIRTRQLTVAAEGALQVFEAEWISSGVTDAIALTTRSNLARTSWIDSYRMIIQGLQLSVAAIFFGAFIYVLAA
jgi:hypothetical protein